MDSSIANCLHTIIHLDFLAVIKYVFIGGPRGVIVTVVGNEHGDTSSNPFHFT